LFAAHGFDPHDIFVERDARYFDFGPGRTAREQIRATLEANSGIKAQEARLRDAFRSWWIAYEPRLRDLPQTGRLMQLRAELLDSFGQALAPVGLWSWRRARAGAGR
jgi:type I restriction enzyme M protein